MTHEPEATDKLFGMQKRYYDNSLPDFRPATKYNNETKLTFNTKDGRGLDSEIIVGTAGKANFGSSMLIHYLHLSEEAKWPKTKQKALLTSLSQCVPAHGDTWVVHESTAFGMGDEFHRGYMACRYIIELYIAKDRSVRWRERINEDADPHNEYTAIFIPWFVFAAYRMPLPRVFKKTPEEEKMATTYNLDDEQLMFYRWVLPNKCSGDKNARRQEYPSNDIEAFISSGTPSFDVEKMIEYRDKCPQPIARYECLLTSGLFMARPDGHLQVWQEALPGRSYVISADVSEGLEHGDFDSASVWDHATGAQVAHYHGHMPPKDYARFLWWLGKRYNEAWLVPERNNHGLVVVEDLRALEYKWIYMERIEEPPNKPRNRFGWHTSNKTRPLILDTLKAALDSGLHGINCREFFDETLNFKRQADGKEQADEGTFDDRVMDAAIGKYALKKLPPVPIARVGTAASPAVVGGGVSIPAGQRDPGEKAYR